MINQSLVHSQNRFYRFSSIGIYFFQRQNFGKERRESGGEREGKLWNKSGQNRILGQKGRLKAKLNIYFNKTI